MGQKTLRHNASASRFSTLIVKDFLPARRSRIEDALASPSGARRAGLGQTYDVAGCAAPLRAPALASSKKET